MHFGKVIHLALRPRRSFYTLAHTRRSALAHSELGSNDIAMHATNKRILEQPALRIEYPNFNHYRSVPERTA
jgi:hypothetical protein